MKKSIKNEKSNIGYIDGADHTYTLKFTPSDKIMNGSQIKGDFEKQVQWGPDALNEERWGTVADGWYSSNVTQMGSMNFVMVEKESHVVCAPTCRIAFRMRRRTPARANGRKHTESSNATGRNACFL